MIVGEEQQLFGNLSVSKWGLMEREEGEGVHRREGGGVEGWVTPSHCVYTLQYNTYTHYLKYHR